MGPLLRLACCLAPTLVAVAPHAALAGVSGSAEVGYTAAEVRSTDVAGRTDETEAAVALQRLRLNVEHQFFPKLALQAAGGVEQSLRWAGLSPSGTTDPARLYNFDGTLAWLDPIFGGGLGYSTRIVDGGRGAPILVSEIPSLVLSWRPHHLPATTLRLERLSLYDTDRRLSDRVTDQATLSSSWAPSLTTTLGYTLIYSHPVDRLRGTETRSVLQAARASTAARVFAERTDLAATVNVSHLASEVVRAGPGGTLDTVRVPITGLFQVETLPATATDIALAPNPALVDGVSAPAGVNLGFSVALAGDRRPRHLGAEFADPLTRLNRVLVSVDRDLPPNVRAAFTWRAYGSDDNQTWRPVDLAGLVVFDVLNHRFELPLETVEAKFVKVVTLPLDPAVTVEPAYSEIQVTELQFIHAEPLEASRGWTTQTSASASLGARTRITEHLSHDASAQLVASGGSNVPTDTGYLVANGLAYARALGRRLHFTGRVVRSDSTIGRGHTGMFQYSSGLTLRVLPTWTHALHFSGQRTRTDEGLALTHGLTLLSRLVPYRGVSLLSNVSYTLHTNLSGQTIGSEAVILGATLEPHPLLTLGATASHAGSSVLEGRDAGTRTTQERIELNTSWTPFASLYVAGSVSRAWVDSRGVTLGSATIGFAPLQGGALQLAMTYIQTLEANGSVARHFSPTLRWTIRQGFVFSTSYALFHSGSELPKTVSQTFGANLQLVF